MKDEDIQRVVNSEEILAGGLELFAYVSGLSEPLRVADFHAHTAPLGLPNIGSPLGPAGGFLGAPIRLHGAPPGHFFLSYKQGGEEFTRDDEETLVLFASQAALAIANARRHREEQGARADLETLIDTSPKIAASGLSGDVDFPASSILMRPSRFVSSLVWPFPLQDDAWRPGLLCECPR